MLLEELGQLVSNSEQREDIDVRLEVLERSVSTAILGQLLPLIVTVLEDEKFCHLSVAKNALSTVISLTITSTRVK